MDVHRFAFLVSVFVSVLATPVFSQEGDVIIPGVVIEKIEKNTPAQKLGLQPGDILVRWSRGDHNGTFDSPYDWSLLQAEERPLGKVMIEGRRGKKLDHWVLDPDCACNTGIWVRPNFSASALAIYDRANWLLRSGQDQRARKLWRKLAVRNPDIPWLYPWLLVRSSILLTARKRWRETEELLQEAAQPASKDRPEILASVHRCWASVLTMRHRQDEAAKHYQRALDIDLREGDRLIAGNDFFDLFCAYYERPAVALQYLHRAIEIEEKFAPASSQLANSLHWAGYLALKKEDLTAAEEYFQKDLAIRKNLPSSDADLIFTLFSLGSIQAQHGELSKAEGYYRQALAIETETAASNRNWAMVADGLAHLAWTRGELPKAEYYYRQALATYQRVASDSVEVGQELANLGAVYQLTNRLSLADTFLHRAIRIFHRSAPEDVDMATALSYWGDVLLSRGHFKEAARCYQRALAIDEKALPMGYETAATLRALGDLDKKIGNPSKAEELYRRSLVITEKGWSGTVSHIGTLFALAGISRERRQWNDAARLYQEASGLLESETARAGASSEIHSIFRAQYQDGYREYVDVLAQLHQPEQAVQALEGARARGLLEILSGSHVDLPKDVDPALLKQEELLQPKLADRSNQRFLLLSKDHTEDQIKTLDKEIADLLNQQEDIEEQIRSSSPAYAALTHPQPLKARDVQQQLLDSETVLLEYSLGDERSYLFTLTPTSLSAYELPGRKKIEQSARHVYALLTARNRAVRGETTQQKRLRLRSIHQAYQQSVAELGRMILAPASAELENKRLLIVSDGALAYIPFAILPTLEGTPLIANHEIVNLPSASALALLRQQEQGRSPAAKAVAVLADPVFTKDDPRVARWSAGHQLLAANSSPRSAAQSGVDSFESDLPAHLLERSIGDVKPSGRLHLGRLPYTRQEAQAIAAAVPAGQGLQALDFQASRSTAMSADLAQYRIVHFATHGLLDSRHPELSEAKRRLFAAATPNPKC